MISKLSLRKLSDRMAESAGYDRDINIAIFERVYLARFPEMVARGRDDRSGGKYEFSEERRAWIQWSGGSGTYPEPPSYTTSVDAILDLALSVFPGWTWSVSQNSGEQVEAWIASPKENALIDKNSGAGSGNTPARAMCAALVNLLIKRPEALKQIA